MILGNNDIAKLYVKSHHVHEAIKDARVDFEQGAVGAGRGMTCHGLKGGIGSSSRIVEIAGTRYTIGCLVLSNYGITKDLMIGGRNIGVQIDKLLKEGKGGDLSKVGTDVNNCEEIDKGSIMVIMACDIPLVHRQIKRILKRGAMGLARVGSRIGHGSGDVFIGFSTAFAKRTREVL